MEKSQESKLEDALSMLADADIDWGAVINDKNEAESCESYDDLIANLVEASRSAMIQHRKILSLIKEISDNIDGEVDL